MLDVPTLAFPIRVLAGQIHQVEQGTVDDVQGQVHLLCSTPPGWFGHGPNDPLSAFGLADQAHRAQGPDLAAIERQIDEHVPDAAAAIAENRTALNQGLAQIGVRLSAEPARG